MGRVKLGYTQNLTGPEFNWPRPSHPASPTTSTWTPSTDGMYWRTQPWHTQDVHPSIPQTSFPWSRTSKKLLHWMLHGSLWSNGTSFYLRKESHIVVKNQIHPLVFCHPNSKVNIQILTFQLLTISPEHLDSPLNKRHSTPNQREAC